MGPCRRPAPASLQIFPGHQTQQHPEAFRRYRLSWEHEHTNGQWRDGIYEHRTPAPNTRTRSTTANFPLHTHDQPHRMSCSSSLPRGLSTTTHQGRESPSLSRTIKHPHSLRGLLLSLSLSKCCGLCPADTCQRPNLQHLRI